MFIDITRWQTRNSDLLPDITSSKCIASENYASTELGSDARNPDFFSDEQIRPIWSRRTHLNDLSARIDAIKHFS